MLFSFQLLSMITVSDKYELTMGKNGKNIKWTENFNHSAVLHTPPPPFKKKEGVNKETILLNLKNCDHSW